MAEQKRIDSLVLALVAGLLFAVVVSTQFFGDRTPREMGNLGVLLFLGFAVYWLPSVLATGLPRKRLMAVVLINALAGWTIVGWLIALALVFLKDRPAGEKVVANARGAARQGSRTVQNAKAGNRAPDVSGRDGARPGVPLSRRQARRNRNANHGREGGRR
jgi:hypothetical protein